MTPLPVPRNKRRRAGAVVLFVSACAVLLIMVTFWSLPTSAPPPVSTSPPDADKDSGNPNIDPGGRAGGTTAFPAFPWPPPKPTSRINLRPEWLRLQDPPTLGQVGTRLSTALEDARYPHHAYLAVPNGFALVAPLEQIRKDGTPVDPNRWNNKLPSMATMSFVEFLKALVVAPTGHYRVIAFIVTDVPWHQNTARPSEEEARRWISTGLSALPPAVREMRYTAGYQTTALVYQFEKDSAGARFVDVSSTDTLAHLTKAGVMRTLVDSPGNPNPRTRHESHRQEQRRESAVIGQSIGPYQIPAAAVERTCR